MKKAVSPKVKCISYPLYIYERYSLFIIEYVPYKNKRICTDKTANCIFFSKKSISATVTQKYNNSAITKNQTERFKCCKIE